MPLIFDRCCTLLYDIGAETLTPVFILSKGVVTVSYINAEKVLPEWLIREIRSYAGDGLIYIPPDRAIRREWGSRSGARQMLEERNKEIRTKKSAGAAVACLAREYNLSEETIKRILYR